MHQTLQRISAWAVASQQQARRNAMLAATALADLRAERLAADEAIRRAIQRRLPARPEEPVAEGPTVPGPRQPADHVIPAEHA